MDQLWVLVLQLLITPAAIAAAIVWFGKGLVSQLLARDLEQYRHREQRETEQHKQMLGFINFERQTRFSWAHEKEAEAIAELYGKLGAAHRKVALMVHPVQLGEADKELKRKEATDAYLTLEEFFSANRIFLSEKLGGGVEALITAMRTSFNQFSMASRADEGTDLKAWVEAHNRMEKEVPSLLGQLRKEFRAALHIPE